MDNNTILSLVLFVISGIILLLSFTVTTSSPPHSSPPHSSPPRCPSVSLRRPERAREPALPEAGAAEQQESPPFCKSSTDRTPSLLGIKFGPLKGCYNKCSDYREDASGQGSALYDPACFPFSDATKEQDPSGMLSTFNNCFVKSKFFPGCDGQYQNIDGVIRQCKVDENSKPMGENKSLACMAGPRCELCKPDFEPSPDATQCVPEKNPFGTD